MLHALVAGINRYSDPQISGLNYAKADAEAFANMITRGIHAAERRVVLLTDENATKRNIMVAIGEDLVRLTTASDTVILYFAGHGSPETTGSQDESSRYLILHDSEYENIYATGIDMERDLARCFTRIDRPKLIVMFMDCCFSGRAGGRTFEGPRASRLRSRLRTTEPLRLRQLDLGEGRLMIAACDDNQVAREDDHFGHGVFTHYLLNRLQGRAEDPATIRVGDLYEAVCDDVRRATRNRQVPIINGRARAASLPRFPLGNP